MSTTQPTAHNTVEMKYPKSNILDGAAKMLIRIPVVISLYIIGGIACLTIILAPGGIALFAFAQWIYLGSYSVKCPSCAKKFNVQGAAESKPCPHCKTPTVFNWSKTS